jgi:hypothetical protein
MSEMTVFFYMAGAGALVFLVTLMVRYVGKIMRDRAARSGLSSMTKIAIIYDDIPHSYVSYASLVLGVLGAACWSLAFLSHLTIFSLLGAVFSIVGYVLGTNHLSALFSSVMARIDVIGYTIQFVTSSVGLIVSTLASAGNVAHIFGWLAAQVA